MLVQRLPGPIRPASAARIASMAPGLAGDVVRGQAEGRYALARLAHSGLAPEQPAGLRFSFESDPGLPRRRNDAPSDRE